MIKLKNKEYELIKKHAQKAYPEECCGFLFGKTAAEGIKKVKYVTEIMPVNNAGIHNREREFHIDPKDYMLAEKHADSRNLDLIGIYHSHPDSPASPSEYDRIRAMPVFSYIILSVNENGIADLTSSVLNENAEFEYEETEIEYG